MIARSAPSDAIGHLICGLLILGACEAAHDGRWLIDRAWPPGRISLYMTMACAIGQMVAALSHRQLEQTFVRKFLELPEMRLLAGEFCAVSNWRRMLFPGYCKPLDADSQARILRAAARDGVPESSPALFDHALAVVEQDPTARKNLESTLHRAWFWRNLCMGLLIVAAILVSGMVWHTATSSWGKSDWRKLGYCALALVEATATLYRYLKLYRRHAMEVLVRYGEVPGEPRG